MHINEEATTTVVEQSQKRTPIPSDWQHAKILMGRTFRKDRRNVKLWFARFLLMPLLFMIYTVGYFIGYGDDGEKDDYIAGDFRLFQGSEWEYPSRMRIAGFDNDFVAQVGATMTNQTGNGFDLNYTELTNVMELVQECTGNIASSASEELCVFIESIDNYTLFFGGKEEVTPFQPPLAAAQWALNSALLRVTNVTEIYPVSQIQRTPRLVNDGDTKARVDVILVPAIMQVLSAVIMTQFIVGPLSFEKLNGVTQSFLMVGVKMRTYLLQWILFYSLNGIITAGVMTLMSVFYKTFPLSNAGLIFLSHYLGFVQLFSAFTLIMQLIEQEELAQGIPWLVGLISMAIGSVFLVLDSPNSIGLTIFTVFSPYVGMMQYYGIYINYDETGFDTGIHPGDNVAESGLLGNMIAQAMGILLWIGMTILYASPHFRDWMMSSLVDHAEEPMTNTDKEDENDFEPLSPGSEVLLSVRGLKHTYRPNLSLCNKDKPVDVLKGLNIDICRGEVFGYLGHNGAGKTTSIQILSAELQMQHGSVKYHLRVGDVDLSSAEDSSIIRTKIGVCPQHNTTLLQDLTCRETLRFFAWMKGGILMEERQTVDEAVEAEVERRLKDIQFTSKEDADKEVGTYSGGMKRKVLIAMALLGDPEVVFLDEPSAGMDPYNRRIIWDMIIAAKKGRSIILTTHFLDEADVLSDRIGIIKNGKLITCGSSLFLKHHFGAGYTLSFDCSEAFDVGSVVSSAERVPVEKPGSYQWRLSHATEPRFPEVLSRLGQVGATNVDLGLTTLEQVFLETGKEDSDEPETVVEAEDQEDAAETLNRDYELGENKVEYLEKIWAPRGEQEFLGFWKKFLLVQHFMMTNISKMKGTIFLNISMPLVYLIAGVVVVSVIDVPIKGETVVNAGITISPYVAGEDPKFFFGVPDLNNSNPIFPLVPSSVPGTLEGYFNGDLEVFGGYFAENSTLQYADELSPFALQIGALVLSNFSAWLDSDNSLIGGIVTTVQQLPYVSDPPFRVDLLVLPLCLAFGFAGIAFSVLDVLLLKGDGIIGLFRVAGITEWMAYLGVMMYKCTTTFLPFFALVIVLGLALKTVLFGNGGRWLGTILVMLGYAYSTGPMGLILAKRFIHSDFKSVANWFPGVYMTLVGLPYVAWVSAYQAAPDAQEALLIVGDVLCIIPQVAFQRGLGAVIAISSVYDDPNLSWGDVWQFQTRVWFSIVMMLVIGTFEWVYLRVLTTTREPRTTLSEEEACDFATPVDVSTDPDLSEERERSRVDDDGINARDLVKVFRFKPTKDSVSREPMIKRAVKGVSYGVRKNEIFALLGPNGAGKTVTMSILAGQYAPEHGEIALDGATAVGTDRSIDHLYESCKVAYCPQFDALFPKKTVEEHLQFYARIRGLDWHENDTQDHINAIIKLLGLAKHRKKQASQLSGGYKRRLSLGVAMIGYPAVMMVDECTTGLDPAARRLIWDVLKPDVAHEYDIPAILLSSHYMDECEALGTRIGIMIDGEVVTTGSLKRLQELYCTSYFVEISLRPDAASNAEELVCDAFEVQDMSAIIYESLPYRFKLKVPFVEGARRDDLKQLAQLFDLLETNKGRLGIKFYSVALMNLEQIFIDLSRKQFEADSDFVTQQPSSRKVG